MAKTSPKYINRELSWLEFNQRVLDEALDETTPLLERSKFLAISGSNLDEFFMVSVGGLQQLGEQGSGKRDPAGMTPAEQLEAIAERTQRMTADQYACFLNDVEPQLANEGVRRIRAEEATDSQIKSLEQVFEKEIFSVLTPMAVTGVDDFPLLVGRPLGVCIRLEPVEDSDEARYAVVPFGSATKRFVTLPSDGGYHYMLLEDVVAMFVERFFPGEQVAECVPFRITRNADLGVQEDLASDLLSEMQQVLDARKQSDCVRLEISDSVTSRLLDFIQRSLDIERTQVYATPGPLDLASFMQLSDLQGFEHLKYDAWPPKLSPAIDPAQSMFEQISNGDVLLYHPFESFDPVLRWIEEAAVDPDVLAIKQTLYRTSRDSPIVAALIRASERGKHVTAIVELKARFDEARNIEWARNLEQAGVQVIYGVRGLKVHAKVCIVVRREPQGIQRYVHFGTGNYNEITARLYTDVSLLTADEELGADAVSFFNSITGYSQPQRFRRIEAAPLGLREKVLEMIESETERKRHGQKARINAKMNSLVDSQVIDALYEASQAGVKIRLNIRGICCLRPGIKGVSENITVTSIVDRFLEHSRIFHFYHGGDDRVFISSADWMPRNLDRRVELLTPVDDEICKKRLIAILKTCFRDNAKASRLLSDGTYERVGSDGNKKATRSQETLHCEVNEAVKQAEQTRRTVFEPYRSPEADV